MDIISNKVYENVTFDKDCAVDEILTGAKFIRCSFQGMDLEDITTNKCTFSECNLKAIRLNGSKHINSAFTNCQFDYANLFSSCFEDCKMLGSSFPETNFMGISITKGDWSYTNLRLASFIGQDLREVNFSRADMYRCNLQKADLRGANLSFAILTQASLCGAKLQDAIVEGVDFRSANIKGVFMDYTQAVIFARSFGIIID